MPQFNVLDTPEVQKMVNAEILYQLWHLSAFLKAAVTEFNDSGVFEHGSTISITRPKLSGAAEDYDPRNPLGLPAGSQEPGYVTSDLRLDKLFTHGFPIYSTDANVDKYVRDYGESNASAIRESADRYMYETGFRVYPTTTGIVQYADHAPVQMVWLENSSGELLPMARHHLQRSNAVLKKNNVPATNRYAVLSANSIEDLFENAPVVEGQVGANAGGAGILTNGVPQGTYVNRYGFMVGSSNEIQSQLEVDEVSGTNPTVAIAAVEDDTTFYFKGDLAVATPLGCVKFTLGAAPTVNFGVGNIARIGATGSTAKAYGVVLRIDGNDIYLVPCDQKGILLKAANFDTGTDLFSVPQIDNLNVAYHKEHLIFGTRRLQFPGNFIGASITSAGDPDSGLVLQVAKGSYEVDRFKQPCRTSILMGADAKDARKAVLMLSS